MRTYLPRSALWTFNISWIFIRFTSTHTHQHIIIMISLIKCSLSKSFRCSRQAHTQRTLTASFSSAMLMLQLYLIEVFRFKYFLWKFFCALQQFFIAVPRVIGVHEMVYVQKFSAAVVVLIMSSIWANTNKRQEKKETTLSNWLFTLIDRCSVPLFLHAFICARHLCFPCELTPLQPVRCKLLKTHVKNGSQIHTQITSNFLYARQIYIVSLDISLWASVFVMKGVSVIVVGNIYSIWRLHTYILPKVFLFNLQHSCCITVTIHHLISHSKWSRVSPSLVSNKCRSRSFLDGIFSFRFYNCCICSSQCHMIYCLEVFRKTFNLHRQMAVEHQFFDLLTFNVGFHSNMFQFKIKFKIYETICLVKQNVIEIK